MKTYTIKLSNNKDAILLEDKHTKTLISEDYNYIFNKSDGFFVRWGKTKEDDGDINVSLPKSSIWKLVPYVMELINLVNFVTKVTPEKVNI